MKSILEQLASGDQSAVARCLDEYGNLVWDIAGRYLGSERSEVEDAVQEVFMNVWLSAKRFDPAKGSEAAFIATIAHRRLTDRRRRAIARRAAMDRAAPLSERAAVEPPTTDELARLGDEFAELPEEERAALWMSISKGLSHGEIAEATRVPVGTVKSRLRRGLQRLRRAWGLLSDEPARAEECA